MSLLPEGQENNIEVSWQDQQKINKFSRYVQQKDVISADLEVQRQEKEYFTDVIGEIEMLELEDDDLDDLDLEDESDPSSVIEKKVQYKIGDTFVFMDYTQASERAQVDSEKIDNKIGTLESKLDDINGKLQLLKTQLYAKFGDNINLERD